MDDKVEDVVAFRRGVFRMAAGVLIETRAVDQKRIGRPAVGNQALEDIPEHLFHRQIDPAVRRKDQAVLILKAENPLFDGARINHDRVESDYTPARRSSTEGTESYRKDLDGEEPANICNRQPAEFTADAV